MSQARSYQSDGSFFSIGFKNKRHIKLECCDILSKFNQTVQNSQNMSNNINKKINLLHLVQGLKFGGAEMLLLHYIKALGTENYEHYVYCFGPEGPIKQRLEDSGITVHMGSGWVSIKNPFRFAIGLVTIIKDLLNFIKTNHIQLIQSHLGHANKLCVAVGTLLHIPTFPTVHNTMAFVDRRSRLDPRVYLIELVDMIVYRKATYVVAVSQEIKKMLITAFGLPDARVLVLKNGIVLDNTAIEPAKLTNEFHIDTETLKVFALGSLSYQKAFEILIQAAAELVQHGHENLLVLIVGEGIERRQLETLVCDLEMEKYVKLPGVRNDIMALMQAADMFVMPSRYEGLSIAMIEAMSCGLPIIASDAPGLNTYITHEYNGLLFPVEDYKALANSIIRLSGDKNLRKNIAQEAKRSFEKEYNMLNNIKPINHLFKQHVRNN